MTKSAGFGPALFLLFTQRSAYEITFGDVSSDVCSSDLSVAAPIASVPAAVIVGASLVPVIVTSTTWPTVPPCPSLTVTVNFSVAEIGRASCRDGWREMC